MKVLLDTCAFLWLVTNDTGHLSVKFSHVTKVSELPFHHKDPFDRLLIAQAMIENLPILTGDPLFKSYNIKTIWK